MVHPEVHHKSGATMNDKQIQAAMKAATKETVYKIETDGRGAGTLHLIVRPRAGGAYAAWFVAWKRDGVRQKKVIGTYPSMGLAAARDHYRKVSAPAIRAGVPETLPRQTVKRTLRALFEGYLSALEADGKRTTRAIRYRLMSEPHGVGFILGLDRVPREITQAQVIDALSRAYKRGARRIADQQRTFLAAAFNWGLRSSTDYRFEARQDWGYTVNPVAGTFRDSEANQPRERTLTAAEISTLWRALGDDKYSYACRMTMKLILACGQRQLETIRASAEDFDLDAKTWTLPRITTKGSKSAHTIPLPDIAVPIVRELIQMRGGVGLLFAGRDDKTIPFHFGHVSRTARAIVADTGIEHFQPKDLRRTWKTRAGEAGVSRYIRDLVQQHGRGDVASIHYDRHDYIKEMREGMAIWDAWLSNVVSDS